MDKLDRLIEEALSEEDRAMLEEISEPGLWHQAAGLFRGRIAWVSWWLIAFEIAVAIGAVWAGWHFFAAATPLAALKWGLPAAVAAVVVMLIEMSWLTPLHASRVLRELKRLELMLASRETGA